VLPRGNRGPTGDDDAKLPDLAFRGVVFGCVAIGVVSGLMGAWPLFFAFPGITLHLILSALLGGMLTVALLRRRARRAPHGLVLALAGLLTFAIFAVLPLILFFERSSLAANLLFRRAI
jgi:hypothetical protein